MRGPAFIDEVQRAPDLLLAIKRDVDRNATPGRFLLTGSANLLTAHKVKDALTGRFGPPVGLPLDIGSSSKPQAFRSRHPAPRIQLRW